jgi:hypothetical protein
LDVRRKSFGSGASYNKETNLANKKWILDWLKLR